MAENKPWPLIAPKGEYSDLHWFDGWGARIRGWDNSDDNDIPWEPTRLSWFIFRPDEFARNAMIRLGVRYPQVIRQVREFLDHAERMFSPFCDLLPPDECSECHKCGYLIEDEDELGKFLLCEWCGDRIAWTPSDPELVDRTASYFHESLIDLGRVIGVATETIWEAVLTFSEESTSEEDTSMKPEPGYLGLIVCEKSKTVCRDGYDIPVDLSKTTALWPIFQKLFKATESGIDPNGLSSATRQGCARRWISPVAGNGNWLRRVGVLHR